VKDQQVLSDREFLGHFVLNAPQLVWFLGAGVSRSAGIPTAEDITWDLKRKYYCLNENQDLETYKINNPAIKQRIQAYLEARGYPLLGSRGEYSFYFDLTFGSDYALQQKYIYELVNNKNVSLNVGHRVFAALLEMGLVRIVFTTNFDEVIETAFSLVTGKSLSAFHLEGSYAALDALNSERFPIYAKVHGDFRYRSIKNLSSDLLANDKNIQKCFLAAASRFGLIVAGFSGRDNNVMEMFHMALSQSNAFPLGLFWMTPRIAEISGTVHSLIESARAKGIDAYIVEIGTFDTILARIWRQLPKKNNELDLRIRTAKANPVSIPLPEPSAKYPILRTNALPITAYPRVCSAVSYVSNITYQQLNEKIEEYKPNSILVYTDRILFWGDSDEVGQMLGQDKIREIVPFEIENPIEQLSRSGIMRSFYEHALVKSLCREKPIVLRRKYRTYYAVISTKDANDPRFMPLKKALSYGSNRGIIFGAVPRLKDTTWAEALSLKLEIRNGSVWLLVEPDIWINPFIMRESAVDFLRAKKFDRYNNRSNELLNAWISMLFGSVGSGQEVEMSCFPDTANAPVFRINTRTAFSGHI
jgi:hypothetical protein